jgi:hypothetical protein
MKEQNLTVCLALALVHHLCIGKNLPFERLAEFLSNLCNSLVIEFVPKEDKKVQQLLSGREDIFPGYNRQQFEAALGKFFVIEEYKQVKGTERIIYKMKKN